MILNFYALRILLISVRSVGVKAVLARAFKLSAICSTELATILHAILIAIGNRGIYWINQIASSFIKM